MRSNLCFLAMLLAFVNPTTAYGNWQSTRWGMSVDDLISTTPNTVRFSDSKLDMGNALVRAAMPYKAADIDTVAFFLFEGGLRLSRVQLVPRKMEDCSEMQRKLYVAYGKPLDAGGRSTIYSIRWRDTGNGNIVVFVNIGNECSVTYSAISESLGL